jgi:hypothetical protein
MPFPVRNRRNPHPAIGRPTSGMRAGARSALRRAFAVAAVAWVIILPLAAFAASRPRGGPLVFGFAYGAYAIGSVICHQLPARSFHLWSAPLPVCARCAGIYAGAAIAAVLELAAHDRSAIASGAHGRARAMLDFRHRPLTGLIRMTLAATNPARRILIVAAMPTAATLIYQWTTGGTPANWTRALAGAPIGVAVAWIVGEVD